MFILGTACCDASGSENIEVLTFFTVKTTYRQAHAARNVLFCSFLVIVLVLASEFRDLLQDFSQRITVVSPKALNLLPGYKP